MPLGSFGSGRRLGYGFWTLAALFSLTHALKLGTPTMHGFIVPSTANNSIPVFWSAAPAFGDPTSFNLVMYSPLGGTNQMLATVDVQQEGTPESGDNAKLTGIKDVQMPLGEDVMLQAVDVNDPTHIFHTTSAFTVSSTGSGSTNSSAADPGNADDTNPGNLLGTPGVSSGAPPSAPTTSSPASSSTATTKGLKPGIFGAIIAGIILLLLIFGFVLYAFLRRRRREADLTRRTTFHRSMMFRAPLGTAPPASASGPSTDFDPEKFGGSALPNPYAYDHNTNTNTYAHTTPRAAPAQRPYVLDLDQEFDSHSHPNSRAGEREFEDVSIARSPISITTISDSFAASTRMERTMSMTTISTLQPYVAPSESHASHSHAHGYGGGAAPSVPGRTPSGRSTRKEPELYAADLMPQRYR
uniref:Uncharacterized protein n=1 Tax=Mycena chlorophos TaxID=658473 RepID=A0ABQ0KUL6_MYCCL|nr:predicted protein [Mycena chlorophos]